MNPIQSQHQANRKYYKKYAGVGAFVVLFALIAYKPLISMLGVTGKNQTITMMLILGSGVALVIAGAMKYVCPECQVNLSTRVQNAYWNDPEQCPNCDTAFKSQ